jgi:hypothetical protein
MEYPVTVRRVLYERVMDADANENSAQIRTMEEKNVGDDKWDRRTFFEFHSKIETPEGNKITRVFKYRFTKKIAEEMSAAMNELWDYVTNEEPGVRSRKREYEKKVEGGFVFTMKIPPGSDTPPSYHLTHPKGGNYAPSDIQAFFAAIGLVRA